MADIDPSKFTVKELRDEIKEVEDPDELESILEAEKEGKDRKTAKEAIERQLDRVPSESEEAEEENGKQEGEGEGDEEEEEDDGLEHPTYDKQHVRSLDGGVYKDMWVYCETHEGQLLDVSKEMLGKARKLMDTYNDDYDREERVVAMLVGDEMEELANDAIAYGADVVVYQEDDRLNRFLHKPYTEIVADMCRADGDWRDYDKPRYILFPATNNGRDLSAQVQAELDSGLASDCNELYIENTIVTNPVKTGERGSKKEVEAVLHMKRPDFSGYEWSTILCLSSPTREFFPQGASVIPGSFDIPEYDEERDGLVIKYDMDIDDSWFRVNLVEYDKLDTGIDLSGNDVIVALGRGIGDDPTKGLELGLELVDKFDDADLGLSRGVVTASYDVEGHVEEYVTEERQIGETGQIVEPNLYIAAGISGAVQHKVGMDQSDTILAINTDPDARIKDFSDYFIVGDLFEVIPEIMDSIESGKVSEVLATAETDGGGGK